MIRINSLISAPVDEVFVSVLTSNVVRAMSSRVDMHQVIGFSKPVEVTYTNSQRFSGILVRLMTYYDLKSKSHMRALVLFYLPLETINGVYVGDVILSVDGIPAMQLTAEELQRYVRLPYLESCTVGPVITHNQLRNTDVL